MPINNQAFKKKRKQRKDRIALRLLNEMERPCDECTACCTVMGVPELGKRYGERCGYLCERGCGVYASRPKSCEVWSCVWKVARVFGYKTLTEDKRPDLCGLLLDMRDRKPSELVGLVKPEVDTIIGAYELWSGAAESNSDVLDEIVEQYPVDFPTNGGHPDKGVNSPWEVHHGQTTTHLHP